MTLSARELVSLSIQTLVGTPVTPTVLVPVTSFGSQEIFEQIRDNGRRGPDAMDFGAYQGVGRSEITIESPIYVMSDTTKMIAGYFFHNLLGSEQADPTLVIGAVYNHILLLGTTKRYLTIDHRLLDDANDREFAACRVTEIGLSFNRGEGAPTMRVTLQGRKRAAITAAEPADKVSTLFKGWESYCTFEGATASRLISAELTFRRSPAPFYSGEGSQDFADLYLGPLEMTASVVMDYSAVTDLTEFRTKGQAGFSVTFRQGTADAADERKIAIGVAAMDWGDGPAVIDDSGENLTLQLTGRALYSTANGPITGAAQNGSFEVVIRQLATTKYG